MQQRSIARRHHYLPQSYLAGFTDTGKKDGTLYIADKKTFKGFFTSPLNVAVERDFYKTEGEIPDELEGKLSGFENLAAQAIRKAHEKEDLDWANEFEHLINFMVWLATHNPHLRKSFNAYRESRLKTTAVNIALRNEDWVKAINDAGLSDEALNAPEKVEGVRQMLLNGRYKISYPPESNIAIENKTFENLFKLFAKRIWALFVAPHPAEFICSDYPVTCVRKENWKMPAGFALPNTEVFFPLTRKVALSGVFERPFKEVCQLNPSHVALMNTKVWNSSARQVYSSAGTFMIMKADRSVVEMKLVDGMWTPT